VEFTGYYVVPPELERHIEQMRKGALELDTAVAGVPGLCPSGGPSWTGTRGGHEALQSCLKDIAALVRKTDKAVLASAGWAAHCLETYTLMDEINAEAIRACLKEGP
jgi:hypothetical protein